MKHTKYKHLYHKRQRTDTGTQILPAAQQEIEQWLNANVTDKTLRRWYMHEAAKHFLIECKGG